MSSSQLTPLLTVVDQGAKLQNTAPFNQLPSELACLARLPHLPSFRAKQATKYINSQVQ